MIKRLILCISLAAATGSAMAQSAAAMTRVVPPAAPDGSASATGARHVWFKGSKSLEPGKAASDSAGCSDKKDEQSLLEPDHAGLGKKDAG
jgi:hypothetical protein